MGKLKEENGFVLILSMLLLLMVTLIGMSAVNTATYDNRICQARIREFLREYNRRTGATVLLTSHYMADVTALCERILIIHHGRLKYDGSIGNLSRRIAPFKLIGVMLEKADGYDLSRYGEPVQNEKDAEKHCIQVKAEDVTKVTSRMLSDLPIHDITITDPPIEDVIERAFNE